MENQGPNRIVSKKRAREKFVTNPLQQNRQAFYSFFFGGLLPVVAFSVIEEKYGPLWGAAAGMIFGVGEVIWEKVNTGTVSRITLGGNALILLLGAVSIFAQEGIWFKLQPAIMEFVFGLVLMGSVLVGKPLLVVMAAKQGRPLPEPMVAPMTGITFRLGVFFLVQAALATWAALHWSTAAWAFLKGVGLIVFLFGYMAIEMIRLRLRMKRSSTQKISEDFQNK